VLSCSSSGGDDDDSSGDDDDAGDDDGGGDDDASGNLTWQDPPSSDEMTWEDAKAYCDNLSFDGHDDWRLPTISELRSLIRGCDGTVTGGACGVTDGCLDLSCWNDACSGCNSLEGPGSGGAYWPDGLSGDIDWYWSSSAFADHGNDAWFVHFGYGGVGASNESVGYNDFFARCVR
jgi:hypothetical protein